MGAVGVVGAIGVTTVALTSFSCKAVEELQDHLSVVQIEMRNYKLDTASGAFVTRTPPPTKRAPDVIAYGGAIYALGGLDGSFKAQGATEKYDPATDKWTTLAPWPNPRSTSGFFELASQLCTLGGELVSADDQKLLTCYDPAKNTWADRAPIPVENGSTAFRSVVAAGKLYSFSTPGAPSSGDAGAFDARTYDEAGTDVGPPPGELEPSAFFAYDPSTNAWTQKTSAPFECNDHTSTGLGDGRFGMVAIGSKVYVLGCLQRVTLAGTVPAAALVYDTVADTWTQLPPAPIDPVYAFVIGAKVVAVSWQVPYIAMLDPATSTWSVPKATAPVLSAGMSATADATGVYYYELTAGTGSDAVYVGNGWRYDLAADTWKKVAALTRDVDATYRPLFTAAMGGADSYLIGAWGSAVISIH